MFKSRHKLSRWALCFAVVLIASACGGSTADDDAGSEPGTVVQTTTTQAAAEDVSSGAMDDHMDDGDAPGDPEHMDSDATGNGMEDGDGHDDEGHMDDGTGSGDVEGTIVEPSDVPEDARVVFVSMFEWGYDPGEFNAKAGETVIFRIFNEGAASHEFRLSNAHRIEEHIASGHEDHASGAEAGDGHHSEDGDIMIEIEAGSVGELVVTFPTDTSVFTEVACLLPGHYENGMFAELTYES